MKALTWVVMVLAAVGVMRLVYGAASVLVECGDTCTHGIAAVSIGFHTGTVEADRAAVSALAQETARWPHARAFVVRWANSWEAILNASPWAGRTAQIFYDRRTHFFQNWDGSTWTGVTDQMIRDTARHGRGASVFSDYGCPEGP